MTKTAKSTANKSEFIRQLPNDLPAAEVVKRAKAAGLTLNAGLVYAVRSNERHKPGAAGRRLRGRLQAPRVPVWQGKRRSSSTLLSTSVLRAPKRCWPRFASAC